MKKMKTSLIFFDHTLVRKHSERIHQKKGGTTALQQNYYSFTQLSAFEAFD